MARSTSDKADTEKQLKGFIAKFDLKHQTVIRGARKVLRERFPTATELVYDNYNFLSSVIAQRNALRSLLSRLPQRPMALAYVSSAEPAFRIRQGFFRVPVNKLASFDCLRRIF